MVELGTVEILGGGPAGLYVASLIKRVWPAARVRVREQNPRGATFGFGVVFSDRALDFLAADDPDTHALLVPLMERWTNMTLVHRGERLTIDGVGFAAVGRLALIEGLSKRAEALGVEVEYGTPVSAVDAMDADLVVGADGLHSLVRQSAEDSFAPSYQEFGNRFAWFGVGKRFETLTQTFVQTECGAMNAHHYRYAPEMSTFIVECDAKTFAAEGFGDMDEAATARRCEAVFAETLRGVPLVANRSQWRRFPKLWCARWTHRNCVLIGDAAHTAHFSIGSGTRLAMEDALALVAALRDHRDLGAAFSAFEAHRIPIAKKIVDAANTSAVWYETFAQKMSLEPLSFAFDYITRSGRVDLARLRSLSPAFMAAYEGARETAR